MDENKEDPNEPIWKKCHVAAAQGDCLGALFLLKSLADKGVWEALAKIGLLYEAGGGNLERNLEEANKWYRRALFECDDPVAHLGLGRAYQNGVGGVQRDFDKALQHYTKAYAAGLPEAALNLGLMVSYGKANQENIEKAKGYFEYAAQNEYCLAYIHLAKIAFKSGHITKGIKFLINAHTLLGRIKKIDPHDPRLVGM